MLIIAKIIAYIMLIQNPKYRVVKGIQETMKFE